MKYNQDFIQEVKRLYPNSHRMHELADSGGEFLGRYLDDGSSSSIPIDTILLATSLEELQNLARKEKMKCDLYRKWWDYFRETNKI